METSGNQYLQHIKDLHQIQPFILKGMVSTGKRLGHGAFGTVLEMRTQGGGAICAGKKIHEVLVSPPSIEVQKMIVSKCELLSKMRHPNIVTFYGLTFLDDNSPPILVMEMLDRSLDDYLERCQPNEIPFSRRFLILFDITKGLVFLHSTNPPVVHHDLTTRNILLSVTKQAKIADFGNSHIVSAESIPKIIRQNPATTSYMPPEILQSHPKYDASIDMFSFGHVSLYTLTHVLPNHLLPLTYQDSSKRYYLARSEIERRSHYIDAVKANVIIPSHLSDMVVACLHNVPRNRPTAKQMENNLRAVINEYKQMLKQQMEDLHALEETDILPTACAVEKEPSFILTRILAGGTFCLEKRSGAPNKDRRKTIRWKKYIFELQISGEPHSGILKYYKKLNDPNPQLLRLEHVTSVAPVMSRLINNYYFLLESEKSGDLLLRAETEEERDCWVQALRGVMGIKSRDCSAAEEYCESVEYVAPTEHHKVPPALTDPADNDEQKESASTNVLTDFTLEQLSFLQDLLQEEDHDDNTPQKPCPLSQQTEPLHITHPQKEHYYEEVPEMPGEIDMVDKLNERVDENPAPLPKPSPCSAQQSCSLKRTQTIKSLRKLSISSRRSAVSMLLPEDELVYGVGGVPRRPKWAKARSVRMQLSEEHYKMKAHYIPRTHLTSLQKIAEGEFGAVNIAKLHLMTGEVVNVAVKTLKENKDPIEQKNFEREMAISSDPGMKHPNIVRVYGIVRKENYIVMEYLPQGDLKTFLTNNHRPVRSLIKYMLDVAIGMQFISMKGLVHRDLAARNVLMGSPGETCKVSDFGLLRELPEDEKCYVDSSPAKCPVRWTAPESFAEKKFSPASDVWSYGILVWEMFNPKRVPFEEYGNLQVVAKVTAQAMTPLIPSHCPNSIVRLMKSCWISDPSKRPSFLLIVKALTELNFTPGAF